MKERNTKQKELILEVIKNNRSHPTIYEICKLVHDIDPTIGQATIYRNIKKFVENKILYVVKTHNGIDHYERYNNHIHFECLMCNEIVDIMDDELFQHLSKRYNSRQETILNYQVSLEGYCKNCTTNKGKKL